MSIKKRLFYKYFLCFILINSAFFINKVQSAEQIKLTYSIFSRTVNIKSLKRYSKTGKADKNSDRGDNLQPPRGARQTAIRPHQSEYRQQNLHGTGDHC